ncbi:non-ribosomal peptide synthetase [Plantactinospora sp. WMMB782]|uniref:non-ribosomal peptide synthetase n=1 Tax=Plantactinospora sp. WMMB782 TaxID=3404121 RepID=UPI003B956182
MKTVPLSDIQRGIWLTERMGIAGTLFHVPLTITFAGPVDRPALGEACAAAVARHGILGMAVAEDGAGEPCLVPAASPVRVVDAELSDGLLQREMTRPFDLRHGPLARFVLATDGPRRAVLLVVGHHLVFDGMSKDILVSELAAIYNAVVVPGSAGPGPLPPPAVGMHTAGREQTAARHAQAVDYWTARWSEPGPPCLPGLAHVPVTAEPGEVQHFELAEETVRDVEETAHQLGITRFELLFTALQALLHRYGDPAPVVAVDLSTRTALTARTIGAFVNSLPVSAPAADGATFSGYARETRRRLHEVYRFRQTPVSSAVPGLRPRTALAPVTVSYRQQPSDPEFAGLVATVDWKVFNGVARNALRILLVDHGSTITGSLEYSPGAVDRAALARFVPDLRGLLRTVREDPHLPVAQLPPPSAEERRRMLVEWNDTARTYPSDATVVSLFDYQVRARPYAPAVQADERRLGYAELAAAVDELTGRLRGMGVGRGDLVGVFLERSWRTPVAVLAAAKAGAAYLPIDPGLPPRRVRAIVAHADPAVVLTTTNLVADLGPARAIVAVDGPDLAGCRHDSTEATRPAPHDTAYVIYTSGSTGEPKGVSVPHSALANLLLAMRDTLGAGPDGAWLAHTSLSFDIAALELFLPLTVGAPIVIAAESQARDPAALWDLIRRHRIRYVQATPSGWRMLLDGGPAESVADREPVVALSGGEALPPALARVLRPRVQRLFNVYGPTETTVWSMMSEVTEPVGSVTIGRPIANTRVYVCDPGRRLVPAGVAGELYIGGAGVAQGYLRRPDLTEERFLPDPYGPPGARLYRTGDRVRWLPDGQVAFLGRLDDQVKVRGHRVELGEIEARLLEHPQVAQAAVRLHHTADQQPRLVGYLVPAGKTAAPEPAQLRRYLGEVLPAVMVPAEWVTLDRLPTTRNGKLDRAALPPPPDRPGVRPPEADTGGAAEDAEPSVVEQLQAIWQAALQIDQVRPDDDLFDLGGHSLTIVWITNQIERTLGVEVPLEAFYAAPTITDIAALVARARVTAGAGR